MLFFLIYINVIRYYSLDCGNRYRRYRTDPAVNPILSRCSFPDHRCIFDRTHGDRRCRIRCTIYRKRGIPCRAACRSRRSIRLPHLYRRFRRALPSRVEFYSWPFQAPRRRMGAANIHPLFFVRANPFFRLTVNNERHWINRAAERRHGACADIEPVIDFTDFIVHQTCRPVFECRVIDMK